MGSEDLDFNLFLNEDNGGGGGGGGDSSNDNAFAGVPRDLSVLIKKIQSINAITDHDVDLRLPRIVAVGDQSSGKTSTIETLVRRDFLPRGDGCVTRCPIIITLRNVDCGDRVIFLPDGDSSDSGGGGGGDDGRRRHERKEIVPNWEDVRREIEERTRSKAGREFNIVDDPIKMVIESRSVPDLELVDMPGLTRNKRGDQSEDVHEQTKRLTNEYIKEPNTIILVITPATVELETCEGFQLARAFDPRGARTIGVITKPDIKEEGGDYSSIVKNLQKQIYDKVKILISVKNRTKSQTDRGVTAEENLEEEEKFFSKPVFAQVRDRTGSKTLLKVLCRELGGRIKERLPELSSELTAKIDDVTAELTALGHTEESEQMGAQQQLLQLTGSFIREVTTMIYGMDDSVSGVEEGAGSAINKELKLGMLRVCQRSKPRDLDELREEVTVIINNLLGIRNSLTAPVQTLEIVVKKLVKRYRQHLIDLINRIRQVVLGSVQKVSSNHFDAYPALQEKVMKLLSQKIEEHRKDAVTGVNLILDAEQSFVNTEHPSFWEHNFYLRGKGASGPLPGDGLGRRPESGPDGGGGTQQPAPCLPKDMQNVAEDNKFSGVVKAYQKMFKRPEEQSTSESVEEDSTSGERRVPHNVPRVIAQPTEPHHQSVFFLDMVEAYMRIVETTLTDLVPKIVVSCLIRQTVRKYMGESHFLAEVLRCEGEGEEGGADLEALARRHDHVQDRIRQLLRKREELLQVQRVVLDTSDMDRI